MSDPAAPTRIVTVFGENLNLYEPRDADKFLAHMRSYGAAARCEWGSEYLLAERVVSEAVFDASGFDDDDFDPGQRGPCSGHKWVYTGEAYGGDELGEGRVYCEICGADGDA